MRLVPLILLSIILNACTESVNNSNKVLDLKQPDSKLKNESQQQTMSSGGSVANRLARRRQNKPGTLYSRSFGSRSAGRAK